MDTKEAWGYRFFVLCVVVIYGWFLSIPYKEVKKTGEYRSYFVAWLIFIAGALWYIYFAFTHLGDTWVIRLFITAVVIGVAGLVKHIYEINVKPKVDQEEKLRAAAEELKRRRAEKNRRKA